jgi:hypothetical protein
MTVNRYDGDTFTPAGEEQWQYTTDSSAWRMVRYSYLTDTGETFTTTGRTLEVCRRRRDNHFYNQQ